MTERVNEVVKLISNIPYEEFFTPIKQAYERNDFYIRELVTQLRLDQNFNHFIEAGKEIFYGVTHATMTFIRGTSNVIKKGADLVEFVIRKGIEHYDVMVGEILNVLVTVNTMFFKFVGNLSSYAGHLEEFVMRKVEYLRQQATNLYLNQIRPYLQELNKYAITLRDHFYRLLQTIFKGSISHILTINLMFA